MNERTAPDPLELWLEDPDVSEILIDGAHRMSVERRGQLEVVESPFRDEDHLMTYIRRLATMAGQRVDDAMPLLDLRLRDGTRIAITLPPISPLGPTVTMRKAAIGRLTLEDLIRFGSLTAEMGAFLQASVKARANILVTGGTGSGKTSVLAVVADMIPPTERIIAVQDPIEFTLTQPGAVLLEGRPATQHGPAITANDLLRHAGKMRADRLVLGEFRGAEALSLIEAMNTGYDGSLATLHATSPRDALSRLETMIAVAAPTLPLRSIREQIASAVTLIISQARLQDGRRRILWISEVAGMDAQHIVLQDLFVFRETGTDAEGRVTGEHVATGVRPSFGRHLDVPDSVFEAPAAG